ncbi:hypothetical protein ACFL5O_10085 [Myxococcota bacterium]
MTWMVQALAFFGLPIMLWTCGSDDDENGSAALGNGEAGNRFVTDGPTAAYNNQRGGADTRSTGGRWEAARGGNGGAAVRSGATGVGGNENLVSTAHHPDLTSSIHESCSNERANGFVLGCSAALQDQEGYLTACKAQWSRASEQCPAELEQRLDCAHVLDVLSFDCGPDGQVVLAPGVCSKETEALERCLSGS